MISYSQSTNTSDVSSHIVVTTLTTFDLGKEITQNKRIRLQLDIQATFARLEQENKVTIGTNVNQSIMNKIQA